MKYKLNFFIKYSRHIRYFLFFLTLILMITSVKVYLNDSYIDKSIKEEVHEEKDLIEKNDFENNFYLNYLSGNDWWLKYADFFIRHDNRVTLDQEQIIEFSTFENNNMTGSNPAYTGSIDPDQEIIEINEPKDAWDYFLWLKVESFKNNFENISWNN